MHYWAELKLSAGRLLSLKKLVQINGHGCDTFLYLLAALTLDISGFWLLRTACVSHRMCRTKVTFEQESGAALATLLSIYISRPRHMIPSHFQLCSDGRAAIATIAGRQCSFHSPAAATYDGCHGCWLPCCCCTSTAFSSSYPGLWRRRRCIYPDLDI